MHRYIIDYAAIPFFSPVGSQPKILIEFGFGLKFKIDM